MSPTTKSDGPKLTLPVGHPAAGYVEPDLSFRDPADTTLPDEEQEILDERNDAREEAAQEVAENEHKVATEEAKAREEQAKKDRDRQEQVAAGKISQQQANEMRAAQDALDATAPAPTSSSSKSSS